MKDTFTGKIIDWHFKENKRTMPWKGEKDPYKIWISEVILQQTRVQQGLLYYNNFIKEFPTVRRLAAANDEMVFKIWEGLGYYARCKNLLVTARNIVDNLNGNFPRTYDNIISLKGIGPYTAAAICSFAYGLPHAVVDGNVFRVLARYFGEALAIDAAKGKQHFTKLANELLFTQDSAAYNQAIMDFGATVCKPRIPECNTCILRHYCLAYNQGLVNKLPVKEKQLTKKNRWFTYFVFLIEDKVLVNKRLEKDIWENLYEFYLFETEKEWNPEYQEIELFLQNQLGILNFKINNISRVISQKLTHQNLQGKFISVSLNEIPAALQQFKTVGKEALSAITFPKLINEYIATIQIIKHERKLTI